MKRPKKQLSRSPLEKEKPDPPDDASASDADGDRSAAAKSDGPLSTFISHAGHAQHDLERARRKSFVRAIKPLRRLRRNQEAVNDSLIEAGFHLAAQVNELPKLQQRIAELEDSLANLHQRVAKLDVKTESELPKLKRRVAELEAQIRKSEVVATPSEQISAAEPRSAEEWQTEIDRVQWYHEFDFGNGLRAHSATPKELLKGCRSSWRFIETQLGKFDLANKSVLDVGAWDGFWSFYAERSGARSVLATDDISQNWASGEGLHLARKLFGSNIEVRQDLPIYNLASLGRRFDIILCLGVFYHLRDPFYGFTQLRHCCHANSIVLLEGEVGRDKKEENAVYYLSEPALECLPGESGIKNLLQLTYFRLESLVWMRPTLDLGTDRAFIVCRPFTGTNEMYIYKPHFGLHVYDDRFNQSS